MWWVGFKTINWTGEGGEPTWYETFPGEAKRGFCPTCVVQAERVSRHVASHGWRSAEGLATDGRRALSLPFPEGLPQPLGAGYPQRNAEPAPEGTAVTSR